MAEFSDPEAGLGRTSTSSGVMSAPQPCPEVLQTPDGAFRKWESWEEVEESFARQEGGSKYYSLRIQQKIKKEAYC